MELKDNKDRNIRMYMGINNRVFKLLIIGLGSFFAKLYLLIILSCFLFFCLDAKETKDQDSIENAKNHQVSLK